MLEQRRERTLFVMDVLTAMTTRVEVLEWGEGGLYCENTSLKTFFTTVGSFHRPAVGAEASVCVAQTFKLYVFLTITNML